MSFGKSSAPLNTVDFAPSCVHFAAAKMCLRRVLEFDVNGSIVDVQDSSGHNCLHSAAKFLLDRPDVFALFIEKADHKSLNQSSRAPMTPFHHISYKIGVIEKFRQSLWPLTQVQRFENPWKCARLYLRKWCGANLPFLHSCLQVSNFCEDFVTLVIRRYSSELLRTDEQGNLPLHRWPAHS